MHLAALQLRQTLQGTATVVIIQTQHRERHQHLIGVEPWIIAVQQGDLGLLYGLYHLLRDEFDAVINAGQMLGRIQDQGGAGAEERARLGADERPVREFDRGRRYAG